VPLERGHLPYSSAKSAGGHASAWRHAFIRAPTFAVLSAAFTALLAALMGKVPPGVMPKDWAWAAACLLCAPVGCAAAWGVTALVFGRTGGGAGVDPVVEAVRESADRLAALETELREAPPGVDDVVMTALFAERHRLGHLVGQAHQAGVSALPRKGRDRLKR